ncbi:MAG: DUF4157 domain-containing protein [Alphaproteobacteria bacterium]
MKSAAKADKAANPPEAAPRSRGSAVLAPPAYGLGFVDGGLAGRGIAAAPSLSHAPPGSPGQPLDPGTRSFMEARFGRDFGDVRLHTGPAAAAAARGLNAAAYAIGADIVFGAGQFQPHAPRGRRILAHELAHVAQQAHGGAHPTGGRQEEEAHAAAAGIDFGPVGIRQDAARGLALLSLGDLERAVWARVPEDVKPYVRPLAQEVKTRLDAVVPPQTQIPDPVADVVQHPLDSATAAASKVKDKVAAQLPKTPGEAVNMVKQKVKQKAHEAVMQRAGTLKGVVLEATNIIDTAAWLPYAAHQVAEKAVGDNKYGKVALVLTDMVSGYGQNMYIAGKYGLVDKQTGAPMISDAVSEKIDAAVHAAEAKAFADLPPEDAFIFTSYEQGELTGAIGSQVALAFVGVEEVQVALKVVGAVGSAKGIYDAVVRDKEGWHKSPAFWGGVLGLVLSVIGLKSAGAGKKIIAIALKTGGVLNAVPAIWQLYNDYNDKTLEADPAKRETVLKKDLGAVIKILSQVVLDIARSGAGGAKPHEPETPGASRPSGAPEPIAEGAPGRPAAGMPELPAAPAPTGVPLPEPVARPAVPSVPDTPVAAPHPQPSAEPRLAAPSHPEPPPAARPRAAPPPEHVQQPKAAKQAAVPHGDEHAATSPQGAAEAPAAAKPSPPRPPEQTMAGTVKGGQPSEPPARAGTPTPGDAAHQQWISDTLKNRMDTRPPPLPRRGAPPVRIGETHYELRNMAEALRVYDDFRARAPGREVGIYRNAHTGEYAVVAGREGSVSGPLKGEPLAWDNVLHNHPNPENVLTFRNPAPQDLQGQVRSLARGDRPVTSFIEHELPGGGRRYTAVTVASEKVVMPDGTVKTKIKVDITYHGPDGKPATRSFPDFEDFVRDWGSRKVALDPEGTTLKDIKSNVDEWLREQRKESGVGDPWDPGGVSMAGSGQGKPGPPAAAAGKPQVGSLLEARLSRIEEAPLANKATRDGVGKALGRIRKMAETDPAAAQRLATALEQKLADKGVALGGDQTLDPQTKAALAGKERLPDEGFDEASRIVDAEDLREMSQAQRPLPTPQERQILQQVVDEVSTRLLHNPDEALSWLKPGEMEAAPAPVRR